jgi:hypothetical protein
MVCAVGARTTEVLVDWQLIGKKEAGVRLDSIPRPEPTLGKGGYVHHA